MKYIIEFIKDVHGAIICGLAMREEERKPRND
jgi:hypothetical protein